jgi:quercetin dioxygenase-like cupin family protein
MSFPPRRVVVSPGADGRGAVVSDAVLDNARVRREGHESYVVWATDAVPADNQSEADPATVQVPRSLPGGAVFRLAQFAPGVASDMHRTDSLDYAIVLSGSIELALETETVVLHAGDVLVQRGTAHDWVNRGEEPCVIAFCLIGAHPPACGSRKLC